MPYIDYSNLFEIDGQHGLDKQSLESSDAIPGLLAKIHSRDQGFYKVIDDDEMIREILDYVDEVQGKFKHIVVCGIGGSALGTICIKNSLGHLYKPYEPNLHILDNIDPDFISELEEVIDPNKTLFIIISKSGGTVETISQYLYFKGKAPKENFVFITDPVDGWLREQAEKHEIKTFDIPQNIGGRFSVLTPVGLLPAALIGIDIRAMIEGAKHVRDRFLSDEFEENPSYQLAKIQYELYKKGKNIAVMYPYSQRLIYLADWYKQLLAESIGKNAEVGITPVKALGVTDQHSQSQLYMDGPFDKLIMFIEVEDFQRTVEVPNGDQTFTATPLNKLMKIEKMGTEEALTQKNKPNLTIHISRVNEITLGGLFMLFEGSIAFLGEMFNINAFDQPGVELSKIITKQYLDA